METAKYVTEDDDPSRCQANAASGQCRMIAVEGRPYCRVHAGPGNRTASREEQRNYRLSKFQARVEAFADNDQIKSLREEIGITRMLIEELVNQCNDNTQLVLHSNRISDLIMKAEKLVTSCHRIEASTGLLLDKGAIMQLANVLVDIISRYIKDETHLNRISTQIIQAIAQSKPLDSKGTTP